MKSFLSCLVALLIGLSPGVLVHAQAGIRPAVAPGTGGEQQMLRGVGVNETYETPVPLDARFLDHTGRSVTLGELHDLSRPVVLLFVYYQCATTCDVALRALGDVLVQVPGTVGEDFEVFTISMDPHDTVEASRDARSRALGRYGRDAAERGWHFLTGDATEIQRVADAVGYQFRWDEATQQFVHPGLLTVLRPDLRVGRYLFGLEQSAFDLRLSLTEAAAGNALSVVERAILFCYRFDAHEGRYVIVAWRIMRVGGGLIAAVLGFILMMAWRRERRRALDASR